MSRAIGHEVSALQIPRAKRYTGSIAATSDPKVYAPDRCIEAMGTVIPQGSALQVVALRIFKKGGHGMLIYIISKSGHPLMPTGRSNHVRRLLNKGGGSPHNIQGTVRSTA